MASTLRWLCPGTHLGMCRVTEHKEGGEHKGGVEVLTLFCFPELFSFVCGHSFPTSSAFMSATGTGEQKSCGFPLTPRTTAHYLGSNVSSRDFGHSLT